MSVTNGECQACKQPFRPDDDIVICPECGAPYHRDCYAKSGKCVYEAKHKSGFEYHAPAAAATAAGAASTEKGVKGTVCSRCGTVNDAENIFCENCGQPLGASAAAGLSGMPFGARTFEDAYYGAAVSMEGEIDGVKKTDWATFIGRSSRDYIAKMSIQQQRNSMLSFTPSALFFPTFYFAYRKMWLWAVGSFLAYLVCAAPVFLLMLQQAGVTFVAGFPPDTLNVLANIASLLNIAAHALYGMFAVYLYRRSALKKIKAVQKRGLAAGDYAAALARAGGASVWGLIGGFALYFLLGIALYAIGGDAPLQYFYPSLYQAIVSQSGAS